MDLVLIRRCRAGDDEAFALLFEQYKNLVYHTAYLILGTVDDAEDILQDVFLQVHRSLDSYDPARGSFSSWLYRITVNRCLNWRRGRPPSPRLDYAGMRGREAAGPTFETLLECDSVRRSLDRLSDKLRVTVVLRHYWDLSYAEIAEILDLPLGTVKSRLNQAMRHMKDDLESDLLGQAPTVEEVLR